MSRIKTIKTNPVAKHMGKFNQSKVYRDKKKDYQRKIKHPGFLDAPSFA